MQDYIKYDISDTNTKELVINDLYIAPENRGKGRAKELILSVIKYAEENNFSTVGLYAEPSEENINLDRLLDLYRSCGFESDGDCNQLMTYQI